MLDAVTTLTSLLADDLDKGSKCLTVFLDLKKAFETVSVTIVIYKLEASGVRGIPLKIYKDYLTNCKQRVRVGEHVSYNANVTYGIPQGSVLCPTLFLLNKNDI